MSKTQQRKRIPIQLEESFLPLAQRAKKPSQVVSVQNKPKITDLPCCRHGRQLSLAEFQRQADENGQARYAQRDGILAFSSEECLRCYPICDHGEPMNNNDVEGGKRFSSVCPACTGSTDKESWDKYLGLRGLGMERGQYPSEVAFTAEDGTALILRKGKKYITGGRSEELDETDAHSINRDDMPARPTRPPGHGPDDEEKE
jgi:hypothetical protein